MKTTEYFPIVDIYGNLEGKETRKTCHSGTFLLHPVVHLHVFNSSKELYLQKRSLTKDIQPGKWDTSVGGHVDFGEEIVDALKREVFEELCVNNFEPIFVKKYDFRSEQEYELIHCFYTIYDQDINPDPVEISEGRFWSIAEIQSSLDKAIFTPNFEHEFVNIIQKLDILNK